MAVANVPETYKPALAEGSGRFTILRIWLAVSSTEAIELVADPGIVLATAEDVINAATTLKTIPMSSWANTPNQETILTPL
jgi:phage-related tail fiber protein